MNPASVSPAVNSPRYAAAERDATGLRLILLHTYSSTCRKCLRYLRTTFSAGHQHWAPDVDAQHSERVWRLMILSIVTFPVSAAPRAMVPDRRKLERTPALSRLTRFSTTRRLLSASLSSRATVRSPAHQIELTWYG